MRLELFSGVLLVLSVLVKFPCLEAAVLRPENCGADEIDLPPLFVPLFKVEYGSVRSARSR